MNERGTEAAAATAIEAVSEMARLDQPTPVALDRPFVFGVVKQETLVFVGQIA